MSVPEPLYESAWTWKYDRVTDEIKLELILARSLFADLEREVIVDGLGNDAYFAACSAMKETE